MNIILVDLPDIKNSLLPLSYTRPVSEMRVGTLTIREKWELYSKEKVSFLTDDYLKNNFPTKIEKDNIVINGALCPDNKLWNTVKNLNPGETIQQSGIFLAQRCSEKDLSSANHKWATGEVNEYQNDITLIQYLWNIFSLNEQQLRSDFDLLTKDRVSEKINDPHTVAYHGDQIFIEEGVNIKAAILNAEGGPIYLGKGSNILEGAVVQGPFSLGESSTICLGAKIRPNTTVGPHCKIGGEINNSIIFGYSNKSHDGFLGNSVIGEWCNLGANTNNSNLKNNYGNVKTWNYYEDQFKDTGLMFCGLMMGDHSKCGINTMFNTGTIVGVGCNIFGGGFPPKFLPSFSWGGRGQLDTYRLQKMLETTSKSFSRRNKVFNDENQKILKHVFKESASYRTWEKDENWNE